jgi:transposase
MRNGSPKDRIVGNSEFRMLFSVRELMQSGAVSKKTSLKEVNRLREQGEVLRKQDRKEQDRKRDEAQIRKQLTQGVQRYFEAANQIASLG